MTKRRWGPVVAALVAAVLLGPIVTTCSSSSSHQAKGRVLRVPSQYHTIQAAVDHAKPGDLVLVSAGVYHEAVNVATDGIVIRGVDRNQTILEGDFERDNGIRVLGAKNVAAENLTARDYKSNGFFWTDADGYRGSYLTAYRNGDYGVYAFKSTRGLFENSYASGSPDAGFYIGGCQPCDALIRHVVSEYNGLGYSGTNSGGNLAIVDSVFRYNRAGVVPNSGSYEDCYPERGDVIAGNLVYDNGTPTTPAIDNAQLASDNGILVAGGQDNTIVKNLVYGHKLTGIALVPFPETDASDVVPAHPVSCAAAANRPKAKQVPSTVLWPAKGNQIRDNVVRDSGLADLATADTDTTAGNCFSGNTFKTTAPADLETLEPCGGTGRGDFHRAPLDLTALIARTTAPPGDYKTQPAPPHQPGMADPSRAPARPFTGHPPKVDLDRIKVPTAPK